jgi:hypothetical protein
LFPFGVASSPLGSPEKGNPFVEQAIGNALAFICESVGREAFRELWRAGGGRLEIKLRADNDFYSQRKAVRQRLQAPVRRLVS